MAEQTMMDMEEKAVLCNDVLLYMKEHDATLHQAYRAKMVPKEMRMTLIEIIEFLYPSKH